ncbi:unnamed protein product [Musa acuminata var. zebrina]
MLFWIASLGMEFGSLSPQERNTRLENVLANLEFDPQEETIHMYRQLVLPVCNNTRSFSYSVHCFWLLAEGANNTCPHPNAKGWAISVSHKHSTEASVTNMPMPISTRNTALDLRLILH